MSFLLASAPALPLGKAGKFVAAAYIVFVALILVYVWIMAVRQRRSERELAELRRQILAREQAEAQGEQAEAQGEQEPTEKWASQL
jgi:flagellar biosynthesis/type III secretory pathway M-ring protein FliF/YscJ